MLNNRSGLVETSINSILKTFKTRIDFLQPVYECIANAFEASANDVSITFTKKNDLFNSNIIEKIEIVDNGVGFTTDNISSFSEYMSDYKADLGCKGIGRFTWLKVFNKVDIDSNTLDSNVHIDFSKSFNSAKSITTNTRSNSYTETRITFSSIVKDYELSEVDLKEIKSKILDYFSLKFVNFKKNKSKFKITLLFDNQKETITCEDVGELRKNSFDMEDQNEKKYSFEINYSFTDNSQKTKNECYLCGNERIVEEYKLNKVFSALPDNKYIKILIYSSLFEECINAERTAFTFNKTENNPTLMDPLRFPLISKEIENNIERIILEEFPNIKDNNELIIQKCIDEKPHLAKYIKKDTSLIKYPKDVIKRAETEFENEKEKVKNNFIKILEDKDIDSQELVNEFAKLNDLSCRELAQYIQYRQTIIDSLNNLNIENEKIEKYLHNLFFNLGNSSFSKDEVADKYNNCIWLLDDKYMSYESMHSDEKIIKIKKEISESSSSYYDNKEPDLTIFYSNHDVVVVEFKAIGANTDDKINAYTEINRNIGIVAKNFKNINNIYGYVITKFNKEFKDLVDELPSVKALFSSGKDPIYYIYNDNIKDDEGNKKNVHIYFVSTENIYLDAYSRNKLFIDIIKNK